MSMQLSNSKLRQAQLKPDRGTAPLTSPCSSTFPYAPPTHSSVEQQPGLALAPSPLLPCFPAPLAGHTFYHAIASNALKEKTSHTHKHTQTHAQYASVALIDTWRETRGSSWQAEGRGQRQLANAKNAKSTRLLSLEMPNSQTHRNTHTHAATPANEIMLKLALKSMQRFSRACLQLTRFRFFYPLPHFHSSRCVRLCLVLIGNHILSAYIKIVINLNKQETG